MIQIYKPANADYASNGDMTVFPSSCKLLAVLNGSFELCLTHPLDDGGRWKYLEEESVISAPTFQGTGRLFRIGEIEKTDTEITVRAYPVFFDSAKDCFLLDTCLEGKNGQEALDLMMKGTRYRGMSDIKRTLTTRYVRKNLMEAINGQEDNSFIRQWGGEILFDNYTISVNERVGGDYGVEVRYGKNLSGINYHVNMSELVTRIIPVSYKEHMLEGEEPWVDSPNIDQYAAVYTKVVKFDDVKLSQDAQDKEESFETLEDLRAELKRRCGEMFAGGADTPAVTIGINMADLARTEEYKDYQMLEEVSLGDTVRCRHMKLGVTTKARVIELEWDCLRNCATSMKLGEFDYNYFNNVTGSINRVDGAIRADGTVVGEQVQGVLDASKTSLKLKNTQAEKQDVRAILFEDLDPDSELYGAMCLGTKGLQIADKRTEDGRDWDWTTFGTAKGFFADLIVAGTMLADRIRGGTLKLGGLNNINGRLVMQDADGNEKGRWDNAGIYTTGQITSDNPADKMSICIDNGRCYIRGQNGDTTAIISYLNDGITIQTYGGTKTASLVLKRDGSANLWGDREISLSAPSLHVGGRAGKTGTANFSDGSYLEYYNGILIGGRTADGTTF